FSSPMTDSPLSVSAPAPAERATRALPAALRAAQSWARSSDCEEGLGLVVSTCMIEAENVHWLGTALHTLARPSALQRLRIWRDERPALDALYGLAAGLAQPS